MRQYAEDEAVDFAIVGTGAGGGTLACKLAEYGFSVVALDAGPYWRPLEDFASDERHQAKLYWTDERIVDGENPLAARLQQLRQVGRRLDRALRHGVAALPARMVQGTQQARLRRRLADRLAGDVGATTREVEQALKISGPVTYPWGPKRPRYPYRPHETERRRPGAGEGRRSAGHRLDADAARHRLGAARPGATLASIAACA